MPDKFIVVPGWENFQHYKNRNPSWIKLYTKIMSNFTFRSLPDSEKYLLIGLWMLAGRTQNETPMDTRYVRDMCGMSTRRVEFKRLIDAGFIEINPIVDIENASERLSQIKKEREKETEKETSESRRRDSEVTESKKSPGQNKSKRKPTRKPSRPIWTWWVDANKEIGRADPVTTGPDLGAVKTLSATNLTDDEIKRLMTKYLADTDRYLTNQGHPLRLLAARINRYRQNVTDNRGGTDYDNY